MQVNPHTNFFVTVDRLPVCLQALTACEKRNGEEVHFWLWHSRVSELHAKGLF